MGYKYYVLTGVCPCIFGFIKDEDPKEAKKRPSRRGNKSKQDSSAKVELMLVPLNIRP